MAMDGLVVRNTFLDFTEQTKTEEEKEEAISRRPRAVSDLTDTKLPWKVPLNGLGEGLYQVTRRRLGSSAEEVSSPGAAERSLGTVEEEDFEGREMRKRGARSLGSGGGFDDGFGGGFGGGRRAQDPAEQYAQAAIGEFDRAAALLSGGLPLGPGGASMPGGYLDPWAFPGAAPPWPGHFPPMWGMPGLLPQGMPAEVPGTFGGVGKGGGKSLSKRAGQKGGGAAAAGGSSKDPRGSGAVSGGAGGTAEKGAPGRGTAKPAKVVPPQAAAQPPCDPTTVMLRNIPNRYTSGSLLALLNEHSFQGFYDFVYLPMDFQNGVNLGYAFVNLVALEDACRFKDFFQGFSGWLFDSAKVSEVSWAHPHQGLAQHIERYRNSPVMHPSMPDEFKPMIFRDGIRVNFPSPTRVIKAPKLRLGRERPRGAGHEEGGAILPS